MISIVPIFCALVLALAPRPGLAAESDNLAADLRFAESLLADDKEPGGKEKARNLIRIFVLEESDNTVEASRALIAKMGSSQALSREFKEAVDWARKLNTEGLRGYRREGVALLSQGRQNRNFDVAATLLMKADVAGDGEALHILARAFMREKDNDIRQAGEGFLCSAAYRGNVTAQVELANVYAQTPNAPLAIERAFYWSARAAMEAKEIPAEFGELRRLLSNDSLRTVLSWIASDSPDFTLICR